MTLPDLPPGARLLSPDEAVDLLVTGDHPDSDTGTVALDSAPRRRHPQRADRGLPTRQRPDQLHPPHR
jgi:hypothetical protein